MDDRLILIKFYVTLIPSMTVEFCLLSTKVKVILWSKYITLA